MGNLFAIGRKNLSVIDASNLSEVYEVAEVVSQALPFGTTACSYTTMYEQNLPRHRAKLVRCSGDGSSKSFSMPLQKHRTYD